MSEKKKREPTFREEEGANIAAPTPLLVTFEMYASAKGVQRLHWAGMKAFTNLSRATMEEWETALKGY